MSYVDSEGWTHGNDQELAQAIGAWAKWELAHVYLCSHLDAMLQHGSQGISEYIQSDARKLWQRYHRGERSEELYTAIMVLK